MADDCTPKTPAEALCNVAGTLWHRAALNGDDDIPEMRLRSAALKYAAWLLCAEADSLEAEWPPALSDEGAFDNAIGEEVFDLINNHGLSKPWRLGEAIREYLAANGYAIVRVKP